MIKIAAFLKTYWIFATVVAGVITGTYHVSKYIAKTEYKIEASNAGWKETKTTLAIIKTRLNSIEEKEDRNNRSIQKMGTVVTDLSKKVFTQKDFDKYFQPVFKLNFIPEGEKKNEIPSNEYCQYPALTFFQLNPQK